MFLVNYQVSDDDLVVLINCEVGDDDLGIVMTDILVMRSKSVSNFREFRDTSQTYLGKVNAVPADRSRMHRSLNELHTHDSKLESDLRLPRDQIGKHEHNIPREQQQTMESCEQERHFFRLTGEELPQITKEESKSDSRRISPTEGVDIQDFQRMDIHNMNSKGISSGSDKSSALPKNNSKGRLLSNSTHVVIPKVYGSEEQVTRKVDSNIFSNESKSEGSDLTACRKTAGSYHSRHDAGRSKRKDHGGRNDLSITLQEKRAHTSFMTNVKKDNRVRECDHIHEALSGGVMAETEPLHETSCSRLQPVSKTIQSLKVNHIEEPSTESEIIQPVILKGETKPAGCAMEVKNTADLASSYQQVGTVSTNEKSVLSDNKKVTNLKEVKECKTFTNDLASSYQQVGTVSTNEKSVLSDNKKVTNLKDVKECRTFTNDLASSYQQVGTVFTNEKSVLSDNKKVTNLKEVKECKTFTNDLASSYQQVLAVSKKNKTFQEDHNNVTQLNEVKECRTFTNKLTTSNQQVLPVSSKKNNFHADHEKVINLKEINKFRAEIKLENGRQFKPEPNVQQTIMPNNDMLVAGSFEGVISSDVSCMPEDRLSDDELLLTVKSSKPITTQSSYPGTDRPKPDSGDENYLSSILSVSGLELAKTSNDENNLSVVVKSDLKSDTIKHQINTSDGHAIQETGACGSGKYLRDCKSETIKKEHNSVRFTMEKSDKHKLEKINGEKIICGKSSNKDHHDQSVRTNENFENRKSKELSTTAVHRNKHDGKNVNEYELESRNSQSHNFRCQLPMVQTCKKKSNDLLHQVNQVITSDDLPFGPDELPFEPDELPFGPDELLFGPDELPFGPDELPFGTIGQQESMKKGEGKKKKRFASKNVKNRPKSRSKYVKSQPGISPRKEIDSILRPRDDTRGKNSEVKHTRWLHPEAKTPTFEYVDPSEEDHLKSNMNARDKHKKRILDGLSYYLCSQIPATCNVVNKFEANINQRSQMHFSEKYQHGKIRHIEAPGEPSAKKYQSLSGRQHIRSCCVAERKHQDIFNPNTNTLERCHQKIHRHTSNRNTLDRAHASAKHEHLEQIQPLMAACWGNKSLVDCYQHESNTSESLDSICVYSDNSPPRYQAGANLCVIGEGHSLKKKSTENHSRKCSKSPNCYFHKNEPKSRTCSKSPNRYFHKNEPKSEHKNKIESREVKRSRSSLTNSLMEAIKNANESLSTAAKVAEALSLVMSSSSSVLSEETNTFSMIDDEYCSKSALSTENQVRHSPHANDHSEMLFDSSSRHLSNKPQEMLPNNLQKTNYQHQETLNKIHPTKHQVKHQDSKPQVTIYPDSDESSDFRRHVCPSHIHWVCHEDPHKRSIVSGKPLLLAGDSLQAADDTHKNTKRISEGDVMCTNCFSNTLAVSAPLMLDTNPKITFHITFIKSQDTEQNQTANYVTQNSFHRKEHAHNIQARPEHEQKCHRQSTASSYNKPSELSTSIKECAQSTSDSSIRMSNSHLDEYSPCVDPMNGCPLSTFGEHHDQRQKSYQDGFTNNTRKMSTRYNANVNRSPKDKQSFNNVYPLSTSYLGKRLRQKGRKKVET